LAAPAVSALTLIDIDRRAISAARRNVVDPRADFLQADVRAAAGPSALDFVIMNPPFHDEGAADSALGVAFVRRAAQMLRPGGVCRLVANVALPYEAALKVHFKRVAPLGQAHGYKLIEAQR
jgi:16S rRNA (guanine1207-N2)-methyltransferase